MVTISPAHREALEISWAVATPVVVAPAFSARALLELVVPLALTVVGIQNAQGFAVLRAAGFAPPEDRLTTACGVGSLVGGFFGSVSICVTGPVNGILNSSGPAEQRWLGGVTFGVLFALFGVFAPVATRVASALPGSFIIILGGLALLPVLRDAFTVAFSGNRWPIGTLTTFVVTVSEVTILRVGAPFWGLLFGLVVSWLVERDALRAMIADQRSG